MTERATIPQKARLPEDAREVSPPYGSKPSLSRTDYGYSAAPSEDAIDFNRFYYTFNNIQILPALRAVPEPIRPPTKIPQPVRVFVIAGAEGLRRSLPRFFAAHAFVHIVGVAADGRAGVEAAATLRPDLVLTDLRMPGIDGLGVVRQLADRCPAIRVLVMSIHDLPAIRSACAKSGAHGFIRNSQLDSDLTREIERLFGPESSAEDPAAR